MEATSAIFYQNAPSKRAAGGKVPVKLRVQFRDKRRYYSLKDHIRRKEWLYIPEGEEPSKVALKEYARIEALADDIISKIPEFSFGQFGDKFLKKPGDWDNVFSAMLDWISDLRLEGRFGTASSFESTLRAIKEFHQGKKFKYNSRDKVDSRHKAYLDGKALSFHDITPKWLKRFEKHLGGQKKSRSTIGVYTRNLRTLFNLAVKKHKVTAPYPFDEYQPFDASDRKVALSAPQVALIHTYKTEDPREQLFRDMFIFSFMANGMNVADILRLKRSNITDNEIKFLREKTKNSRRAKEIKVPVTSTMQRLITRHGSRAVGHNAYIFPILKPSMTPEEQYREVREFTKRMNITLKKIAKAVGIQERVSTYAARHSFASLLRDKGVSSEYLKEALGQSTLSVTERYLKDLDSKTRRDNSELLEDVINSAV